VQLCIVHLIRNSLRHVPWQEAKAVAADLKPIYQPATLEEAETVLDAFAAKWDEAYPAISQIWVKDGKISFPSLITPDRFAKLFTPPTPLSR
jgi:putative transposase